MFTHGWTGQLPDYTVPFSDYFFSHRRVALDFETFYEVGKYSVNMNRKGGMDYVDYVHDERFEPLALAVRTSEMKKAVAYAGDDIEEVLHSLKLEEEGTIVIAHNARFDATILSEYYGLYPHIIECTMCMARAVGSARIYRASLDSQARNVLGIEKDLGPALEHLFTTGAPDTWMVIEELIFYTLSKAHTNKKLAASQTLQQGYAHVMTKYGQAYVADRINNILRQGKGYKGITSVVSMMSGKYLSDLTDDERALYLRYAGADTDATWLLAEEFAPRISQREAMTIAMTMRMYTQPEFILDEQKLTTLLTETIEAKESLVQQALRISGHTHLPKELHDRYYGPKVKEVTEVEFCKFLRNNAKFSHYVLSELGFTPPPIDTTEERKDYPKALHEYILLLNDDIDPLDADSTRDPMPELTIINKGEKIGFNMGKDSEFMEYLRSFTDDDPFKILATARSNVASTINETRLHRLKNKARFTHIAVPLEYGAAHTLRYGGTDKINWQNFNKLIKQCVTCPADSYIFSADSGQIEPRVIAFITYDLARLNVFKSGQCIYMYSYANSRGLLLESLPSRDTPEGYAMRQDGKVDELSLGYGMGGDKYGRNLEVKGTLFADTREQHYVISHERVKIWRQANRRVPEMWRHLERALINLAQGLETKLGGPRGDLLHFTYEDLWGERVACIKMPGVTMYYPKLKTKQVRSKYSNKMRTEISYGRLRGDNWTTEHIYGGKILENVTQCLGACIVKEQLLTIDEVLSRILLNVHDAGSMIVPKRYINNYILIAVDIMSTSPTWCKEITLTASAEFGDRYAGDYEYPSKAIPEGSIPWIN